MSEKFVQIYEQRYETWRHLDRIRYQVIQLSIAFLAAVAGFSNAFSGPENWMFPLASTLGFFALSRVLIQVNNGIVANGSALHDFGKIIGDDQIPNVSDRTKSFFYYFEWGLLAISILSLCWLIAVLLGTPP